MATTPDAGRASDAARPIEAVVLHPIFDTWFFTLEHWEGQLSDLGDALGGDCVVAEFVEEEGPAPRRGHAGRKRAESNGPCGLLAAEDSHRRRRCIVPRRRRQAEGA